jgi:hypothetical protein
MLYVTKTKRKKIYMAIKSTILKKIAGAVIFAVVGYILGYIVGWLGFFPPLPWEKLGFFFGGIYGLFKEEIDELI